MNSRDLTRRRSTLHEWINSVGVLVAVCAAGFATYFAWTTARLKEDNLTHSATIDNSCPVEYRPLGDTGMLGLCWAVWVTNASDTKLSIVGWNIWMIDESRHDALSSTNIIGAVYDRDGKPVAPPIYLDVGEPKVFIVRAPTFVPVVVAKLLSDLPTKTGRPLSNMTLHELITALTERGVDFIGNPAQVKKADGKPTGWSIDPEKHVLDLWEIRTGRGRTFPVLLQWPPGIAQGK